MGLLVPRPSISNLLQSAASVIKKCDSLFHYKVRQVFLQNATAYFVTKCDRFFITKCDRYYHRAPTQSVCVADRYFIVNVVVYRLSHLYWYIGNYVYKSMINKRSITLPVVYSRPFTPKSGFLSDFEGVWVRCWLFLQSKANVCVGSLWYYKVWRFYYKVR